MGPLWDMSGYYLGPHWDYVGELFEIRLKLSRETIWIPLGTNQGNYLEPLWDYLGEPFGAF